MEDFHILDLRGYKYRLSVREMLGVIARLDASDTPDSLSVLGHILLVRVKHWEQDHPTQQAVAAHGLLSKRLERVLQFSEVFGHEELSEFFEAFEDFKLGVKREPDFDATIFSLYCDVCDEDDRQRIFDQEYRELISYYKQRKIDGRS